VAIIAEHSTGGGGEVRPKRPAGGKATPGIAGVTAKMYAEDLDDNLRDLHERRCRGR
jgi:hypothetical protein